MTTSARQEPTRAAGAGSSVRYSGPEGTSSIELWLRRIIARLVDVVPVAVLFAGLWISGSDVLSTKPDACDPAPAPNCNVAAQTDRVDDAGNIIIEYTMLDDRVIDSGHATYQVLDTVYIADPPRPSTYLVTLIYVLVVFVVLQGVTGWTPGKLVAGLRLADDERRAPGIVRSFVRWALPDGALGIVGVVMAVIGGPWPLRLLSVFAALGLLRFIGSLVPVLGPLSDERLGLRFVASADYIGGRPERDDEYDLREQAEDRRPPMQPAPPTGRGATPGDGQIPTGAPVPTPAIAPAPHADRPTAPAPAGAASPAAAAAAPTVGAGRGDTPTLPMVGTPGVGRPSGAPPVFPGVPDAGSEAARQQPAPKLKRGARPAAGAAVGVRSAAVGRPRPTSRRPGPVRPRHPPHPPHPPRRPAMTGLRGAMRPVRLRRRPASAAR
ncbi:MAG: RDD family protein [Acidimicrobiales bacterium]